MIAYASRTGTRRNLAALRRAGWRLMVSARGVLRTEGFRYAIDNGAWTSFKRGEPWDQGAFKRVVDLLGDGADFVVLPDIVAGGRDSLQLSLSWMERLRRFRTLIPVQDGITPRDIGDHVSTTRGIFLGGSTDWKLATMAEWGRCAAEWCCWLHVGRVNSIKRIALCAAAGATSFDGSSTSRYSVTLPKLDNASRQPDLWAAT